MKLVGMILSAIALVATVWPSVAFLGGSIEMETMKKIMLIATIAWFVITPFWMWKEKEAEENTSPAEPSDSAS